MNIVNVAILKEKLSYYLNLVKSGEEGGWELWMRFIWRRRSRYAKSKM